jgi:phosphoenolpyruvate-protein phosphotransferase
MAKLEKNRVLHGIPASAGLVAGPAFVLQEVKLEAPERSIDDPEEEIEQLEHAISQAVSEVGELRDRTEAEAGSEEAGIFEAHAMILQDPTLIKDVHTAIQEEGTNVEAAWMQAIEVNAEKMEALEDEYLQARAADIRDVGMRVLRILLGMEEGSLSDLSTPSIIVASDLTPSDTVRLDKSLVLAFCTAEGGPTSHTAILAKALGLPAVVGVDDALLSIEIGDTLLVNGASGEIIINPDAETREAFEKKQKHQQDQAEIELSAAQEPAVTLDGHQVEVVANVGNPEDAHAALEYGAEGIGLLRTEFLYLNRTTAPDEDEQLTAYDEILDTMEDRPVVVRTLDVGGDKELPYLDLGEEANPFLGWRAIRMCLDRPEMFKIQLRALLRASPGHDLRIMFPMIATVAEVRQARALLLEARDEVEQDRDGVADEIQIGIMVEVPSVVVMAEQFAEEVDFFSIGTNDLTQYTMAAERTNDKVARLMDPCHPAILRQIEQVITAGHQAGIWVGLCGEMAGDPDAIPLLLGLGLDEFSMAHPRIPHAKAVLRTWSKEEAQDVARAVLEMGSASEVREWVQKHQADINSGSD